MLEVLVATIILTIVLGSIYSVYTSNVEMVTVARESSHANQIARVVLDQMIMDFESAFTVPPGENKNISLGLRLRDGSIDSRPADRIDLTTLTPMAVTSQSKGASDLCEVGYYLEPAEEDGQTGAVLYRREDRSPDSDFLSGGVRFELARSVSVLEITVTDNAGQLHEEWDSTASELLPLPPSLISIRLTLVGRDGQERVYATSVHPATGD